MKRIDEFDIRKAGLVPCGHFSNKSAIKLFESLSERYSKIEIRINRDAKKWNGDWKTYKFAGIEGNDCLLKEITIKPYTDEEKEKIKEQFKNGDFSAFGEEREKIILNKTIKYKAADVANMNDVYSAVIRVE